MKDRLLLVMLALVSLLTGCSDSGSTLDQSATHSTIVGTAATGLAIDGLVTATSSSGTMSAQVGIDANGQFLVEVEGAPPFMLMAQSMDGSITLFSIGFEAGTTNITPFSHHVLKDIYNDKQLGSVFNNWSVEHSSIDEKSITASMASLINATSSEFINAGVDANFDVLRSSFMADHTGFDSVLDSAADLLPDGTLMVDGTVSYDSESGDLIFIDPNDDTEIPDDADTPPLPPIDSPDDIIFIDPNDSTEIPDDADTPALPPIDSPDDLIFIDPNDSTEIPDDADTPPLTPAPT